MGEATCLRRSFSNPSQTFNELSEGDPIRALGESVSFGRYMSETLNWEKWSTFSQNRYLEEAEKSSKPGSVAKMRAYFEARYKKIGAKKQGSLMRASDAAGYVEPEVYELVPSLTSHGHAEPLPSVVISSCDPSDQTVESQNEDTDVSDIVSKERLHMVQEQQHEDTTSSSTINTQDNHTEQQYEDAEANASIMEGCVEINVNQSISATGDGSILIAAEEEVTIEKETMKDKLEPRSKQRPVDSLLKSSKKSNMSKLSSSLARLATPVRPKKENLSSVANHKSVLKSVEKKKSTSKLVQMSINGNSDVQPVTLSSPASYKTGIGKVFTPLSKMIRQSFVHTPAPSTSRVSVNSVSRTPSASRTTSATPLSETRRSKIALEKSFARTNTSDQKLQSPSVRNMKYPAPSSITFSPFSFRTEERAAKRREFFEKRLEKEAVNLQLFDKAKTPLARPQQPISKSKPLSSLARGISSQPPQSSFSSRPAWGIKSIQVTLPTKKRHENASPNIL